MFNSYFICSLRGQLNALQEASGGKRLSVNDLVIKVHNFFFTEFFENPIEVQISIHGKTNGIYEVLECRMR